MAVALVRSDILYAWKGPSVLITSMRGDCQAEHPLSGYYFREARFLRTLRLTANDNPPWLCEAAAIDPDRLAFNFVYPEIKNPGGGGTGQSDDAEVLDEDGIPERSLDIRLSYLVRVASLEIEMVITNSARRALDVSLAFELGADYADIQEAQSGRREQEAPVRAATNEREIVFAYGHVQLPYRTTIRHDGLWRVESGRIRRNLTLEPKQTVELRLVVLPSTGRDDITEAGADERTALHRRWRQALTRVEVPGNRLAERTIENNVRDIASFPLLDGKEDEWLCMQAGMPLYPAFFGRDAVTAGWQAASLDRGGMLAAALTRLGRLQSDRVDDWRDEQPGRIPYQVRSGPLALLNLNPYSAYYADYASPLMYIISLAILWAWTGV